MAFRIPANNPISYASSAPSARIAYTSDEATGDNNFLRVSIEPDCGVDPHIPDLALNQRLPKTVLFSTNVSSDSYGNTSNGELLFMYTPQTRMSKCVISIYSNRGTSSVPRWVWQGCIDPEQDISQNFSQARYVSSALQITSSTIGAGAFAVQGQVYAVAYNDPINIYATPTPVALVASRKDELSYLENQILADGVVVVADPPMDYNFLPMDTNAISNYGSAFELLASNATTSSQGAFVTSTATTSGVSAATAFFRNNATNLGVNPNSFNVLTDYTVWGAIVPGQTLFSNSNVVASFGSFDVYASPNLSNYAGILPFPLKGDTKLNVKLSVPYNVSTGSYTQAVRVKIGYADWSTISFNETVTFASSPTGLDAVGQFDINIALDSPAPILAISVTLVTPGINWLTNWTASPTLYKLSVSIVNDDYLRPGESSNGAVVIVTGLPNPSVANTVPQMVTVNGLVNYEAVPNADLAKNIRTNLPAIDFVQDIEATKLVLSNKPHFGLKSVYRNSEYAAMKKRLMFAGLSKRSMIRGHALSLSDLWNGAKSAISGVAGFLQPSITAAVENSPFSPLSPFVGPATQALQHALASDTQAHPRLNSKTSLPRGFASDKDTNMNLQATVIEPTYYCPEEPDEEFVQVASDSDEEPFSAVSLVNSNSTTEIWQPDDTKNSTDPSSVVLIHRHMDDSDYHNSEEFDNDEPGCILDQLFKVKFKEHHSTSSQDKSFNRTLHAVKKLMHRGKRLESFEVKVKFVDKDGFERDIHFSVEKQLRMRLPNELLTKNTSPYLNEKMKKYDAIKERRKLMQLALTPYNSPLPKGFCSSKATLQAQIAALAAQMAKLTAQADIIPSDDEDLAFNSEEEQEDFEGYVEAREGWENYLTKPTQHGVAWARYAYKANQIPLPMTIFIASQRFPVVIPEMNMSKICHLLLTPHKFKYYPENRSRRITYPENMTITRNNMVLHFSDQFEDWEKLKDDIFYAMDLSSTPVEGYITVQETISVVGSSYIGALFALINGLPDVAPISCARVVVGNATYADTRSLPFIAFEPITAVKDKTQAALEDKSLPMIYSQDGIVEPTADEKTIFEAVATSTLPKQRIGITTPGDLVGAIMYLCSTKFKTTVNPALDKEIDKDVSALANLRAQYADLNVNPESQFHISIENSLRNLESKSHWKSTDRMKLSKLKQSVDDLELKKSKKKKSVEPPTGQVNAPDPQFVDLFFSPVWRTMNGKDIRDWEYEDFLEIIGQDAFPLAEFEKMMDQVNKVEAEMMFKNKEVTFQKSLYDKFSAKLQEKRAKKVSNNTAKQLLAQYREAEIDDESYDSELTKLAKIARKEKFDNKDLKFLDHIKNKVNGRSNKKKNPVAKKKKSIFI